MVKVDRTTGKATTSRLYRNKVDAYTRAINLERPAVYTTVVARREF